MTAKATARWRNGDRGALVALFVAVMALAGGCDPCAGVPACHEWPVVGYSGQFIERQSGTPVAGVAVTFVREDGVDLIADVSTAMSDADGFFTLRVGAHQAGAVTGRLEVTPPPPFAPYTVPGFRLTAGTVRGDGQVAGRLVVNPYSQFIGEVVDWRTGAPVAGARATLRLLGGVATSPESVSVTTDELGRFLINPVVNGYGDFTYEIAVLAPGDSQESRFAYTVTTDYLDRTPYPRVMKVPRQLLYAVEVSRRGTGEFLPGVELEFVRTSGIQVQHDTVRGAPVNGRFLLDAIPLEDGELVGDLTIRPPPPFETEVVSGLRLRTHYQDTLHLVGVFGYGPQVLLRVALEDRATGAPLRAGTHGIVQRVGGLGFVYPPGAVPSADSGIRDVDTLGVLPFVAATADTGEVLLRAHIRFPGFAPETLPTFSARARSDSVANRFGPYRVGPWYPWFGDVRDADTDAPIEGAAVTIRTVDRAGGHATGMVTRSTGPDGRFWFLDGSPRSADVVRVIATIRMPDGSYRDTTFAALLPVTQDDTVRARGIYRLRKANP